MVMAAAGSAIGLGTLWQFPYMVGENGGGIFVLLYLISTFIIGVPVFVIELIMGRRGQRGAVGIFASLSGNSRFWKGVGWIGVFTSFAIMAYYGVVAGWGLNYILLSLSKFYVGKSSEEIAAVFDILSASGWMSLFWTFLFYSLTIGVVYQGIRKGIEFWSKILIPSLILLLIGLFLYSLTLPGFGEAFRFVFYPDFAKFKPSGALTALGMAFMTMSLGQGIILTYGSYMEHGENIPKTACIIGLMDIVVSVLASLMIFPIIFSSHFNPDAGSGLIFKTLPVLFSRLPGGMVLSTAFFFLFTFTALTSAIALVEVVSANFIDLFGWTRKKAVLITGIATFLVGIPCAFSGTPGFFPAWKALYGKTVFETIVALVSNWTLPFGGLLTAIFGGWFLSERIARQEFEAGSSWGSLFRSWRFFARWIAPAAILIIILQGMGWIDVDRIFR